MAFKRYTKAESYEPVTKEEQEVLKTAKTEEKENLLTILKKSS